MFKQTVEKSDSINGNIKDLLSSILDKTDLNELDIGANLSKKQQDALELFKKGKSLLLLGSGGVGKTKTIKTMEDINNNLETPKNMYLCATTGVAAYNIGGMTIHSFMGIGTGDKSIDFLIRRIYRNKSLLERLRETDILVIDEISMLSAILFEKINIICQHFRKNKTFFGGIQVILTGDFLQNEAIFKESFSDVEIQDTRLLIESDIFNSVFNKKNKNIIVLIENFRQKGDSTFINLLLRIRQNEQTEDDIKLLKQKCYNFDNELKKANSNGIIPIYLVTSNKKAQIINESNLKKIKHPEYIFKSIITSNGHDKECVKMLTYELESQFKQKGLFELKLKYDARVMLIKNLDTQKGLVNGSVGTIVDFTRNKDPVVLFDNGIQKVIEKTEWELELNNNFVKIKQIPLILAYSLTIHKSQSLTLEYAIMELADCFCNHLVYSALSRVKSLNGLFLKSFDNKKITVNQKIIDYYKCI